MTDYLRLFEDSLHKFKNDPKWDDAVFRDIKIVSNTNVGKVGQDYIECLCAEFGYEWDFPRTSDGRRATQSPWDIRIQGVTFEIKTATEDVGGKYQFNHIRYHREYDAVLCLGVSPDQLHFGVWSKADIATGRAGHLVSMEKGANASYKLTKSVEELKRIQQFDTTVREFLVDF